MGAAFSCLRWDDPRRAPPPMARPPAPHLNACVPDDLNQSNDWRRDFVLNPGPRVFYPGYPVAPPRLLYGEPNGYHVPMKAPPPHLVQRTGLPMRRDVPVIKAPPPHVIAVPKHPFMAPPSHVIVVVEQPFPKNPAFIVAGGGSLLRNCVDIRGQVNRNYSLCKIGSAAQLAKSLRPSSGATEPATCVQPDALAEDPIPFLLKFTCQPPPQEEPRNARNSQ